MHAQESHPLPEDPALAQVAAVLNDAEHWAWIFDHRWRLVYMTDALRVSFGERWGAGADRHRLPRLRAGGTGSEPRLALRPQHD